jgi:hemolysin III
VSRNERTIPDSVSTAVGDLAVPLWRGLFHTWAFFATLPLGVALLLVADGAAARVAVTVYATCLAAGFGVSAAYHRLARSSAARRRLRRMDHSVIFMVIAATYTPLCVLALPDRWGVPLLVVVWAGAAAGVALKNIRGERSANGLYLVLGWAAVGACPALIRRGRPDPSPARFGYHEVWHACTVAASACHFGMISLLVVASANG